MPSCGFNQIFAARENISLFILDSVSHILKSLQVYIVQVATILNLPPKLLLKNISIFLLTLFSHLGNTTGPLG